MPPSTSNDEPARWRMIEATNGYDVDNSWYREPLPLSKKRSAPPGVQARTRGARLVHALVRPLSELAAAQRLRREGPVEPAAAWTRTGQ